MSPVSSRTIRMSRPSITSGFSVEAASRPGNTVAGRKLANSPSSWRNRSSPCSGRLARGAVSNRGSPTAPNSIASADRAAASVRGGSGSSFASSAAPPIGASRNSNCSQSKAPAFSTRTASATTSGPMPSPGRIAMRAGFIARPGPAHVPRPAMASGSSAAPRKRGCGRHGAASARCRPTRSTGIGGERRRLRSECFPPSRR